MIKTLSRALASGEKPSVRKPTKNRRAATSHRIYVDWKVKKTSYTQIRHRIKKRTQSPILELKSPKLDYFKFFFKLMVFSKGHCPILEILYNVHAAHALMRRRFICQPFYAYFGPTSIFIETHSSRAALCRAIATAQAGGSPLPTAAGCSTVCLITGGQSTGK